MEATSNFTSGPGISSAVVATATTSSSDVCLTGIVSSFLARPVADPLPNVTPGSPAEAMIGRPPNVNPDPPPDTIIGWLPNVNPSPPSDAALSHHPGVVVSAADPVSCSSATVSFDRPHPQPCMVHPLPTLVTTSPSQGEGFAGFATGPVQFHTPGYTTRANAILGCADGEHGAALEPARNIAIPGLMEYTRSLEQELAAFSPVPGLLPPTPPSTSSSVGIPCSLPSISSGPDNVGSSREFKLLGGVEVSLLSDRSVLFYFGILSIQEHLTPCFEYIQYFDQKWLVKLTFSGYEISRLQSFDTKAAAMVDACRQGLAILSDEFPRWVLPNAPGPGNESNGWVWSFLLNEYCLQYDLPQPIYTQYFHINGIRYEVEVCGKSYFGLGKAYAKPDEAMNCSAHLALYSILTTGLENGDLSPSGTQIQGQQSLPPIMQDAAVPATAMYGPAESRPNILISRSPAKIKPKPSFPNFRPATARITKKCRKEQNKKVAALKNLLYATKKSPKKPNASNAMSRNGALNAQVSPEVAMFAHAVHSHRSNRSPDTIWDKWVKCSLSEFKEKLASSRGIEIQKLCLRLSLGKPEIRVSNGDVGCPNVRVGAYFSDKHVAHLGPVCLVDTTIDGIEKAREECSTKLIAFLMQVAGL
ncbi:hypothetical protein FQN57_006100 [Myotisia sp. PD_48]|nr:hypothetical protein FQN57_006100 [Myotisia sp. PD_48]